MKMFYAIILVLAVLVSACAQQTGPAAQTADESQPEAQPAEEAAEETLEIPEETTEETATTNEIRVLGQGAFEPNALTINAGDTVTWVNTDSKEAVIIIFKDGKVYENSQKFKPGEQFEHQFKEAGSYQYWRNIAFAGDSATITVQ